jgi:linoleoyl-CoA desaturase
MLGSANISGSRTLHTLTGNLSHQIEHHLFPDLPSNRYYEIAPQVRDLFRRYGLHYNARPLPQQVASAWHKVLRLSLPNGWLEETTWSNAPRQVARLFSRKRQTSVDPAPAVGTRRQVRPGSLVAALV